MENLNDPKSGIGTVNRGRFEGRGSVLECARPLTLSIVAPPQKRQRAGALQDLAASRRFMPYKSVLTIGKRTVLVNSKRKCGRCVQFFGPKFREKPASRMDLVRAESEV